VFGVPGEKDFGGPTRIIVRDVHLSDEEARRIEEQARTDLPYTEAKTEVSIDRVTSAANPRQMERVVAGAVFGPGEIVYSIYDVNGQTAQDDINRLDTLIEGLQLMEDDYLGGFGTRGSGKVKLESIKVFVRGGDYLTGKQEIGQYDSLDALAADISNLKQTIQTHL
jgi:CRISPR-associated protein Csm3